MGDGSGGGGGGGGIMATSPKGEKLNNLPHFLKKMRTIHSPLISDPRLQETALHFPIQLPPKLFLSSIQSTV